MLKQLSIIFLSTTLFIQGLRTKVQRSQINILKNYRWISHFHKMGANFVANDYEDHNNFQGGKN